MDFASLVIQEPTSARKLIKSGEIIRVVRLIGTVRHGSIQMKILKVRNMGRPDVLKVPFFRYILISQIPVRIQYDYL